MTGLLKGYTMPAQDESEDQPEQNTEMALKKRREKIAMDRLHIPPEQDSEV